jgi:hypothetical protein
VFLLLLTMPTTDVRVIILDFQREREKYKFKYM